MDIRSFLAFLGRWWLLLILGPMLAGLATFLVVRQMTPVYQAKATLLVVNQTASSTTAVNQLNDILTNDRLTNTYAQLVTKPSILESVSNRIDRVRSPQELVGQVSATSQAETQLIAVTARDRDPRIAAAIVNQTSQVFIEESADQIGQPGTVSIVEFAEQPEAPVEPKIPLYTVFATVLGLVVAAASARGIDYLDDSVKTPEEILSGLGLPVLGRIGRKPGGIVRRLVRRLLRANESAELLKDYRDLSWSIRFLARDSGVRTLVVVRPNGPDGNPTAAGLAEMLARGGSQVIFVDSLPSQVDNGGRQYQSTGLTDLLATNLTQVLGALRSTETDNLKYLPSGSLSRNASDLLFSQRLNVVIAELRKNADFVIFDSAPLNTSSDGLILSSLTDGALLLVETRRSRLIDLKHTMERLSQAKASVLGTVLYESGGRSRKDGFQFHSTRSEALTRQRDHRGASGSGTDPEALVVAEEV